nr:hypothetical protein [Tanacetum cinerariifolium]
MIPKVGDSNREVLVNETFHVQTDDELTEKELKQIEADDQAIQTILLEKIASNLKFLNNLQPEWSRHVTIVHHTKELHTVDYTQLYDFLKYNQKEVDDLKAERLAKTQDPLALMATSNNPYTFPVLHQDQPSFSQNYMQQPRPNPKEITDPITAMNMALDLMAKAFKLNYSTPTNNNQQISSNLRNRQIAQPVMNMGQVRQMHMVGGNVNQNPNRNGNLVAACAEGTQTDKAPVYDSNGSAEYTELLEPIPEPHQVPKNDNNVISKDSCVEQSGGTVEQHLVNVEETRVLYDSLYNNLAIKVEKVNTVNHKLKETNVELTIELARFKNQESVLKLVKKNITNLKDVIRSLFIKNNVFLKR